MDDDLMPSDNSWRGGVPREPMDQITARKKEQAKTLEATSVLEAIITHFEKRIAYRNTLDAIMPDLSRSPELHQKACEVNGMLKLALIEEKQLLEDLISTYKK